MTYKELSNEFLNKANISIGDEVLVKKENISYRGILIDRSQDAEDSYIVIKLENGYNIGINISNAIIELVKKGIKPKIQYDKLKLVKDPNKENISIISTGGTVSSIIDYKTGAVHPAFTADDLVRANPEIVDLANIEVKTLYNILSENMKPYYWIELAKAIFNEINKGVSGVVIAHGTDTMHYTSAALSFMLKTPVPIVITGAQRSSDRPSTDSFLNLMNSIAASKSDIGEVTVCMYGTLDDSYCYLHKGTKIRKMHTSRRDTFRSIGCEPIATLENGKLKSIINNDYIRRGSRELELNDNIESKVAIIKIFPGISEELINYHIDKKYKGLLLEGTGLGHVPDYIMDSIKRANEEEIPVVMASQCIYGNVNMNVYSTGRKLVNLDVISAGDMIPETAYVKLCWVLGQTENINEVKKLIITNIAGELSEKSSLKHFLS